VIASSHSPLESITAGHFNPDFGDNTAPLTLSGSPLDAALSTFSGSDTKKYMDINTNSIIELLHKAVDQNEQSQPVHHSFDHRHHSSSFSSGDERVSGAVDMITVGENDVDAEDRQYSEESEESGNEEHNPDHHPHHQHKQRSHHHHQMHSHARHAHHAKHDDADREVLLEESSHTSHHHRPAKANHHPHHHHTNNNVPADVIEQLQVNEDTNTQTQQPQSQQQQQQQPEHVSKQRPRGPQPHLRDELIKERSEEQRRHKGSRGHSAKREPRAAPPVVDDDIPRDEFGLKKDCHWIQMDFTQHSDNCNQCMTIADAFFRGDDVCVCYKDVPGSPMRAKCTEMAQKFKESEDHIRELAIENQWNEYYKSYGLCENFGHCGA
jgi:hypothetical protein